jgi:hypothetical protein
MQSSPSFAASTGYLSPQAKVTRIVSTARLRLNSAQIYFGDVLDHLECAVRLQAVAHLTIP